MLDFRPILFITGVLMLPLAVAMCLPAVADAAAEGDRSENAEYIYGKKRLRQILS